MRTLAAVLAFLACSGLFASDAGACSCAEVSPCARFARTAVVFAGEVLEVSDSADGYVARIRVEQSWKGQLAPVVSISSGMVRTSCSVEFRTGERWLIFASDAGSRLSTSVCQGTSLLRRGEPVPEPPVPGRVSGLVAELPLERIAQSRKDGSDPLVPVRSGRAILEATGGRQEAAVVNGVFHFDGVAPGTGRIHFELDGGLEARAEPFEIADGTDCAAVSALARPAGRVGGWVTMADGSSAAGLQVQLLPLADVSQSWSMSGGDQTTNDRGRFEFRGLKPGEYVLRVSPYAGPSGRHPHAVVYYPGVPDAASASVIVVGRQRELEAPFVLPPALPTRSLTTRVRCRDGSIPPIVVVEAEAVTDPPQHSDDASAHDGKELSIRLLREVPYRVTIKASFPLPPPGTTFEPRVLRVVDLEAGAEPAPVEIIAPYEKCARRQ